MIIQSSAVQLEQYHRYDAQRSDKTVVAVGESINTAPGGLRALNLSVNFQQSEQFHYRNDSRQRFESRPKSLMVTFKPYTSAST